MLFWLRAVFEPVASRPPSGLGDLEAGMCPRVFAMKQPPPQGGLSPLSLACWWEELFFSSLTIDYCFLPFPPPSSSVAWGRLRMVGMRAWVIKCSHPLEQNTWHTPDLSAEQQTIMWLAALARFSSRVEEKDIADRNDVGRHLAICPLFEFLGEVGIQKGDGFNNSIIIHCTHWKLIMLESGAQHDSSQIAACLS